jgi:DNA ligase-1
MAEKVVARSIASAILDAEALAYHPASEEFLPFQETTRRRRKHHIEAMAQEVPLKAFVFDILYKNGASLLEKPLIERMKILEAIIQPDDILMLTSHQYESQGGQRKRNE